MTVSFIKRMKCSRCGKEYDVKTGPIRCVNQDNGRLDIYYDYEAIKEVFNETTLSKRERGVWKYRELLPVNEPSNIISLGEGGVPFINARRLSDRLGLEKVMLLDDTRNPTGSFKDRPMTVGVSKAVELGYKTVVSASSGNAAAALSAYSARAGLQCITFVPEEASDAKLAQLVMYGAKVMKVRGAASREDPTVKMLTQVCDRYNWYPCPSFGPMNPYQAEGPKTMSFEIVEGLGWGAPDWVLVPVGAGGAMTGNWKGYLDLEQLGLIDSKPRMAAVQSTGCAPVIRAYEQHMDPMRIQAWERPESVASGLLDPYPWDGDFAVRGINESHGTAVAVTDREILEAQRLLARSEGVFAEPSGVTSLAGLVKLAAEGKVERADCIVVEITGSGLKDPQIATSAMTQIPVIEPSMAEFARIYQN